MPIGHFILSFVPLYREAQVVPQFVQAMLALDYPPEKLQILFLTEEDDAETRNAIRALSLPPHFKILVVPDGKPRTKPRACNYGLMHAQGPYVVIYDAEDIPDPLQLKKAVLTFASHGTDVVCVQAKLNFYNIRQNLLTRWFTAEYSAWFNLILPGLQLAKFSLPLGGTSNHFRAAALRALGAWDAYNVTEDCDLGLRLKRYRMNTVILDSTTLEEANPQLKNWLRQRSRWIKGYMQTYLVHMRNPLEDLQKGRLYDLFSFQMVIGGPFVVIYDAEDIPDPLQLKKAVLTFAGHGTDVVCVQAKLNFYNIRQNLLTRWFTAEYSAWSRPDSSRASTREILFTAWRYIESFSRSSTARFRRLGRLQCDRRL